METISSPRISITIGNRNLLFLITHLPVYVMVAKGIGCWNTFL